jgi:hypothetical protein
MPLRDGRLENVEEAVELRACSLLRVPRHVAADGDETPRGATRTDGASPSTTKIRMSAFNSPASSRSKSLG